MVCRAQTTIKNNKRLKGTDSLLTARRLMFEKIRAFWALKRGTWCAVDFEAWDRDHTVLTEFGWSAIRWEEGEEVMEDGHLIVREHRGYFNHYVSQFRDVGVLHRCTVISDADWLSGAELRLRAERGRE